MSADFETFTQASAALVGLLSRIHAQIKQQEQGDNAFMEDAAMTVAQFHAGIIFLRQLDAEQQQGATDDFNREVHKAETREAKDMLLEGAAALLGYLTNSPENPVPFSQRRELAEKLRDVGNALTDLGIVLPQNFFPVINGAIASSGRKYD